MSSAYFILESAYLVRCQAVEGAECREAVEFMEEVVAQTER